MKMMQSSEAFENWFTAAPEYKPKFDKMGGNTRRVGGYVTLKVRF